MAAIVWTGAGGDGNFNNPANWSPAQVPTVNDTVTIAPAAATAIAISQNDAVGALTTNQFVTLTVENDNSFTIGSAAGGATSFTNGGTFALDSTGYGTDLIIGAPDVTLNGGGVVILSDNGNNAIAAAASGDVLENVNNLIEGSGTIGAGTLTIYNDAAGIIDATGANNALILNTGADATTTNAGLIEATGAAGLVLNSAVNDGAAGRIAAAGGNVFLQGGTIAGGTITTSGTAEIIDNGGGTLDGTENAVTNAGTIVITNQNALSLLGSIVNTGLIQVASAGYATDLLIGPAGATAGTVTLSGSGTVLLSDNGNNAITGAGTADTLVNDQTISGAGSIDGAFTLANHGTVNATGANALILSTSHDVLNYKLLEATVSGGGGLVVSTEIRSSGNGTILANGGNVYLAGGWLESGTLKTANGGNIVVSTTGTLDGSTAILSNLGTVSLDNEASLNLLGTISNTGTILIGSTGYGTGLNIGPGGATAGTVTLTGAGTIATTDNGNNFIQGSIAGDTLLNVNNTVEGAGVFTGSLNLINDATIDATDANALVLGPSATVTNNALLEATNAGGGGLVIETNVNNSGGGTILSAAGNVYLSNGTLSGGTIESSGGGAVVDTGGSTLNGVTQQVTNLGTVVIDNDVNLYLEGTLNNKNTVSVASNGYGTGLIIESPVVTLTGGGTVALSDNGNNYIYGTAASDVLDNVNNIIEGGGQLGNGTLTLVNATAGIIDASATNNQLVINTGAIAVANSGLIEATGAAGLLIYATAIANGTAGTLSANGGNINLSGATIQGGTLIATGAGAYYDLGNSTLDGSVNTVTNDATVVINNDQALYLLGTLTNTGTVSVDSSGYGTDLVAGDSNAAGTVTVTGGGQIVLSDNGNNRIEGYSSSETLINLNNTISGSGDIAQIVLTNDATIDANDANALTINTGSTVINNGLLEATGAGGLVLNGTIDNAGGTLGAYGGTIYLGNVTISGGPLDASGTGQYIDTGNTTLDGSAGGITNNATVIVNNDQALYAVGTLTNHGTVLVASAGYGTDLVVGPAGGAGTFTLNGGGQIVLSDNVNNRVEGYAANDTLINLNNTISGGGAITQMVLINDATIDANGLNALTINTGATVTNNALIEATNTGGLIINGTISDSSGGTIGAFGGNVTLAGADIQGGLLAASNGGTFYDTSNTTLDGSATPLTNTADVVIVNDQALYALGTIVNQGTITIGSTGYGTALVIGAAAGDGTVTLTGHGQILLSDNGNNYLEGSAGTDTLINLNNTISGGGVISQMLLINDATIDATGTNALTIAATVTNNAVIESTNTGGLVIDATIEGSGGGTIGAFGGNITLTGADLQGGVLDASNGGTFYDINNSTLDGSASTLTNNADVVIGNNQGLNVLGTIANQGTITVGSNGYGTVLEFEGNAVTLTGTGTLLLTDNANNYVEGASAATTLVNDGNLIEGAGNFGDGQLTLIDSGIIAATGGNALTLDLGSTGTITAAGELLGIGAGGLTVTNGTYTNLGLIQADDGSTVTFTSNATLTNSLNGTLTGGSYGAISTGDGATLAVSGSAITTDAATIELSGTAASITFGGTALGASLDDITSTGSLALLNGVNFTNTANGGDLTDSGFLELGGGSFTGTTLTIAQGGNFLGFGTIDGDVVNDGTITITGGELVFNGSVTGTGVIVTGTGGIIDLTGGGTISQTISGDGTLTLSDGSYTLAPNPPTITNIDVNAGASLSGTGTLTSVVDNAGTLAAAAGTLVLTGQLTGAGTIDAAAGGTLAIDGGATYAGLLNGPGTFLIESATTFTAGATIVAAHIIQSANLTLGGGESLSNLAGNVYTLTGGGGGDPHRAEIQINGSKGDVFTNAGELIANGAGLEDITVAFKNTGTVTVTAGELELQGKLSGAGTLSAGGSALLSIGGGSFAGDLSGSGTVQLNGVLTLNTGAAINAANIVQTNNVILGTGESLTNLAGNTYALDAVGAGNSRHRAEIELKGFKGAGYDNAGLLVSTGAGTAEIAVAFSNTGTVAAQAGTLDFLKAIGGAGVLTTSSGAVLELDGGGSFAGALAGDGTTYLASALTLNAGATIAAINIVQTNTVTLGSGESLTNQAGDTYTLSTSKPPSPPPHRAEIQIQGGSGDIFTNAGSFNATGSGSETVSLGFINAGNIAVSGGSTLSFLGAVTNNGVLEISAGAASIATTVSGNGALQLNAAGTLSLLAGAGTGQTVDFLAASGALDLKTPLSFDGTIAGFAGSDTIDLLKTAATTLTYSGGTLTVLDHATTVATIDFSGGYTQSDFSLTTDTHGGTLINFV